MKPFIPVALLAAACSSATAPSHPTGNAAIVLQNLMLYWTSADLSVDGVTLVAGLRFAPATVIGSTRYPDNSAPFTITAGRHVVKITASSVCSGTFTVMNETRNFPTNDTLSVGIEADGC